MKHNYNWRIIIFSVDFFPHALLCEKLMVLQSFMSEKAIQRLARMWFSVVRFLFGSVDLVSDQKVRGHTELATEKKFQQCVRVQ